VRLDAPPQLVDRIVTGNDARSRSRIAAIERFDGYANRVAAKRTQTHDVQPCCFERFVISGPHLYASPSER
jgi:hypothetical protein